MSSTARTDRARETFLAVLAKQCNVSEAARAAGIGRRTAYTWREADPEFAAAWDEAEQEAVDKLEKVAWERASKGVSDRMLEILLKAHRGEKYVERQRTELTGRDGKPLQVENVSAREVLLDRLARLEARTRATGIDQQHDGPAG